MIILAGKGQTGKSSLVQTISELKKVSFCSEDFAFVFQDGVVYGYPHQCRVKEANLEKLSANEEQKPLLDRINYFIYRRVLQKEKGRHYSVSELFNQATFEPCGRPNCVLSLNRDCKHWSLSRLEVGSFVEEQLEIISTEFENMASSKELLDIWQQCGLIHYNFDGLISQIRDIYIKGFTNCTKLCCVDLPIYPNIQQAAREIILLTEED